MFLLTSSLKRLSGPGVAILTIIIGLSLCLNGCAKRRELEEPVQKVGVTGFNIERRVLPRGGA